MESSFAIWSMLDSLDWRYLPDPGGLLDQNEALMSDLATISYASQLVEIQLDSDEKKQKNG